MVPTDPWTDALADCLLQSLDLGDDDTDAASSVVSFPSTCFPSLTESSCTSLDSFSRRSGSPTPSVFSVTSSVRAQAYRELHGRAVNNYSDVYRLPADEKELDRLDMQHEMFKIVMGKYPPPMDEVLADNEFADQKAVLDLGCGSGSWIVDVAKDYPHTSCVGVDLVPMQLSVAPHVVGTEIKLNPAIREQELPPNMRSEVDDVNLGLEHFFGDFDVVHCRLVSSGIKDYYNLIDQASRILRPGGMLVVMEFDFRIYGHDRKPVDVDTSVMAAPWLPRWMKLLNMAIRQLGGDIDAANRLDAWIGEHGAFEQKVYREFFMPTAPWMRGSDRWAVNKRHEGSCIRDDIKEFMKSARPLLLGSGMPESLLDELERHTRQELDDGRTPHYIRCEYVYARRRQQLPPLTA